jgi:hypothetical protein
MKVLVVLNRESQDVRVLVTLRAGQVRGRISSLIQERRSREAFDLVMRSGQVEHYFPPGMALPVQPDLTFIEDLLE